MTGEMRRGRSQTLWRYAPGSSFRYSESGAWCQVTSITLKNVKDLRGVLAETITAALHRWNAVSPDGRYPDPAATPAKFVVGEPNDVRYDVWPLVFTCRHCGRLHYYQTIESLKRANDALACDTCGGRNQLRQAPYAFICECGQLDTIFAPAHDRSHPIQLKDRRNFQDSFWYCTVCKRSLSANARSGLGFRACNCRPGKMKRGVILEDPRVYYSQTVDLVDIEPAALEPWRENPGFATMLLAGALGVDEYKPTHLQDLARRPPEQASLSPELQAMLNLLIQSGTPEDTATAMVTRAAQEGGGEAWSTYETALEPYRALQGQRDWAAHRRTIEYLFVRDDPTTSSISFADLIREASERGDTETVERLESEKTLASQIGLVNLRVVGQLPILLAAFGYTRYRQSPTEADEASTTTVDDITLQPFVEQDGKLPIYVVRNTTEALMYELDPWRLLAFLQANCGIQVPADVVSSTPALRAYFLELCAQLVEEGEAHLVLRDWEVEHGASIEETSALVFGVLHSLSHVLKATAHRYVGIDSDALSEYLFAPNLAGLLYASSQVSFTLGGIDAVFRSNLTQWLGSIRDFAGVCSFDPVCEQSGGACLACMYPKFGCAHFNRTVSRAFLVGGRAKGMDRDIEGFWSVAVNETATALRAGSDGGI